tara:strand:- start:541 stop:1311 length:771 start_codon:yes stop_codon:yes gene_type:complete
MSLSAKNLCFNYGVNQTVLNITFNIEQGSFLTILGPNGSGKSTLLKLLAGDLSAEKGQLFYGDENVNTLNLRLKAQMRSMVSQSMPVDLKFTVEEIIEFGRPYNLNQYSKRDQYLSTVVEELNLQDLTDRNYNSLSGGEQARVHIARALYQIDASRADVPRQYLFLDEPFANLDIAYQFSLMKTLRKRSDLGLTVVCVSHDIHLAGLMANLVLLLKDGQLVKIGPAREVITEENLMDVYQIQSKINSEPFSVEYLP